ncbi:hypothetical protein [Capybara microvirus Cap1_SP_94]|nr:hypothetical protein [Capybara microvirus Cap1_SP_94]
MFFPFTSYSPDLSGSEVLERKYDLQTMIDPNNSTLVLHRGLLTDVPISFNSQYLPKPEDTDLAKQLQNGSPLEDYSGSRPFNGAAHHIDDVSANTYMDELSKTLQTS